MSLNTQAPPLYRSMGTKSTEKQNACLCVSPWLSVHVCACVCFTMLVSDRVSIGVSGGLQHQAGQRGVREGTLVALHACLSDRVRSCSS